MAKDLARLCGCFRILFLYDVAEAIDLENAPEFARHARRPRGTSVSLDVLLNTSVLSTPRSSNLSSLCRSAAI